MRRRSAGDAPTRAVRVGAARHIRQTAQMSTPEAAAIRSRMRESPRHRGIWRRRGHGSLKFQNTATEGRSIAPTLQDRSRVVPWCRWHSVRAVRCAGPIVSTPLYACARSISCLLMTTSPESMGGGYSRHFYIGLTTQWRGPKCHVAVQAARRGPLFRPCSRHGVDGGPCRSLSVRVARQSDLVVNPGGVVRVVRLKT